MKLHRPAGSLASPGRTVSLSPAEAGWTYCGLEVIQLRAGSPVELRCDGFEAAVLPLGGGGKVEVGSHTFPLTGRSSVFSAVSDFVFLPLGSEARLSSEGGSGGGSDGGQFAITTAASSRSLEPAYVPAEAVRVEIRGAGRSTRQINNFMAADAFEADSLIAVEVLTPAGNWSGWPPHKHDELADGEVPLEEIYYYRFSSPDGFGFHRQYTRDRSTDLTFTVGDGDVVLVPEGYHGPCGPPPGYDMYFLNVMAGPVRRWEVSFDPAHAWVREAWANEEPDPRLPMTR